LIQKIVDFWRNSYQSDQTAFWFELVSFLFTVAGSLYLAVNAAAPDMRFVYPAFFIGASTGCYAAIRRGGAWIALVTAYFTVINVFGFGRAMGWW
jgi:hypothetical protein